MQKKAKLLVLTSGYFRFSSMSAKAKFSILSTVISCLLAVYGTYAALEPISMVTLTIIFAGAFGAEVCLTHTVYLLKEKQKPCQKNLQIHSPKLLNMLPGFSTLNSFRP